MPLALVGDRLPEGSRIRTGLHTMLEVIDSAVGGLLSERSDGSVASSRRGPDATMVPTPSQDIDAEREAIAEAVREHQPDVGELADPDLGVAEVQAELQAKHAVEAREEAKQARE